MKTPKLPETRLKENTSSVVTSPSLSLPPSIVPPPNDLGTSHESEKRDSEIRELAYKLYQERGGTDGQALQDWLDAEAIIRQGGKVAA